MYSMYKLIHSMGRIISLSVEQCWVWVPANGVGLKSSQISVG